MLWVKILAGLTAALAVVGVGIYMASSPCDGCHGKSSETPKNSCCLAQTEVCPSETSECGPIAVSDCPSAAGCCSAGKAPNADALAACTGGMTVSPAQSTSKLKFACCGE